jgi:predicted nucleic acid-binding protein
VTRYLVDTNVISATSPTTVVRRPELIEWMDLHSSDLFLSAVTIAEIADGIAKAKREGAKRKAADLSAWLRTVLHLYGDRVLPFDGPTAEIAGVSADLACGRGHSPSFTISPLLQRHVGMN